MHFAEGEIHRSLGQRPRCYTQVLIGIGKLGALGDHKQQVNGHRGSKRVKEDRTCLHRGLWMK